MAREPSPWRANGRRHRSPLVSRLETTLRRSRLYSEELGIDLAADSGDLEARLDRFYGVGPVTLNIFLRELRPRWAKADPAPLPQVQAAARELGIDLSRYRRKSVAFARIEAGLIRRRTSPDARRSLTATSSTGGLSPARKC